MENIQPKISIIILTKNNGRTIGDVLKQIHSQQVDDRYEIILVDSGSQDDTLKIISQFKVKLYTIPPAEFGHGKTRNLASGYASGDYLVYLSADAIPANEHWLGNLVDKLADEKTGATFGRQVPYENTTPMEQFFILKNYPPEKTIQNQSSSHDLTMNAFFSNVNSAMKRSVWNRFKFSEMLIISEDHDWARRVQVAGYRIEYTPDAMVTHSHNYNLLQVFRRYFDSGASFSQMGLKPGVMRNGFGYFKEEIRFIKQENMFLIPYAILYDIFKFVGFFTGKHEKLIPAFMKKKLSIHAYFWK
ncbi:MAG: glycosyltransferase [ANME-2 cluster archaeon]|nr:glycosyltransferase [ANME-2 cluster archaeon]